MSYVERRTLILIGLVLALATLLIAACQQQPPVEVTRIVDREVTVEVPGPEVVVTQVVTVTAEPAIAVVPFEAEWMSSGHADASAEAFIHWNEDDPAEVPTNCAKCHSTPGYLDFIGADGSTAGVVDVPAPIGSTITCAACHNETAIAMTSVVFPSGVEVTNLGAEARCMQCHQGRASKLTVDERIASAGVPDDDTTSEDLGFSNIHYYAAAATQYGHITMGGYEYEGKTYDSRYDHVEGYNTCTGCHNPHTLEVKYEQCTQCHQDLTSAEDLVNIRMPGSLVDYDGDGDMEEGIYDEIEGLRVILYQAMQAYTAEVAGTPIIYDSASYPYFFIDTNADGQTDEAEVNRDNSYNVWTGRLAKAAYNYQVSLKDPGRFAHGGKYIIQLLYDSIESLNEQLSTPVDMTNLRRIDHGHFAGSEEAFRHWDAEGMVVPGSCSKCHSAEGLPFFLKEGVTASQPAANGLNCATCHNDLTTFSVYEVQQVTFPSGAQVTFGETDLASNLCINCHQGRESTVSVDGVIGELPDDEVSDSLRFLNIHYFAAGATLFGTEVRGAYEYAGQVYKGRNEHVGAFNTCNECHDTHALEVVVNECADCHENVTSEEDLIHIRYVDDDAPPVDYDGDGDVTEGIAGEIQTLHEALYVALQAYATDNTGTGLLYSSLAYPYYFADANGNGVADADEVNFGNRYVTWTPRLLRAAYNYQYVAKDPGAFAHNGQYVVQLLYDALADLGATTPAMTRP